MWIKNLVGWIGFLLDWVVKVQIAYTLGKGEWVARAYQSTTSMIFFFFLGVNPLLPWGRGSLVIWSLVGWYVKPEH